MAASTKIVTEAFGRLSEPVTFYSRSFAMSEIVNRGGLPRHIHPQCDDRGMDRGEGQLLKLVSFI